MATRSTIGVRQADGKIKAVYCHWDGYPEGVGVGLVENYNSTTQAKSLIKLGGFSSLRETLAETKAEAYGTATDSARIFDSVEDWIRNFNAGEEYFYLWDGNSWIYSDGSTKFHTIRAKVVA